MGTRALDGLASGCGDLPDHVGPHHGAAVGDPRRDHCHLERRDLEPLLAEGEPSRVDLVRVVRREQAAAVVQAARGALVRGGLQGRIGVEAEAAGVVENGQRPELLADLAEDGVDRMLERGREADAAEHLRTALVGIVGDLLAVLDAVAGVVEGRGGLVDARVEGGRRSDDLEGRAGRVEAGGRPVDERRAGRAVRAARAPRNREEVLLDEIGIVRGRRRHDEDGAGRRVERDDRAAVVAERVERDPLGVGPDRQDEVVAGDGCPLEAVERALQHRVQVRVGRRQVVVQRSLEPRARARLRRVSGHLGREVPGGIAAEVERQPVLLHRAPSGEQRTVGRVDQPAPDRELGDALDCVVLPILEPGHRPGLPVRRRDHERREQNESDHGKACDLPVHCGAFARFETSRSPATRMKLATMLDPP